MKTQMKGILIMLTLFSFCSEKEQEDTKAENCYINCKSEQIFEDVIDLTCKIAKFNDTTYILAYDSISLRDSGYFAGSENILVPCELPDSLKIAETLVNVTGQVTKDCCNLLSLPQIRGAFGCKFEISTIQKIN